jgi:DNA-binding NarL/FixJ family response regulator
VRDARWTVVGTSTDRQDAVERTRSTCPEIVIVDMAMPESLATVRDLARVSPETRIIALTVPEVEHAVIACAEAGIVGYVSREGSLDDLVGLIECVARGETRMSPRMVATLMRRVSALAADRAADAVRADLTAREQEIVACIRDGLSNKQIGARLHIELATVKNHVHNVLEKLHVQRRGEVNVRLGRLARPNVFSFESSREVDGVR